MMKLHPSTSIPANCASQSRTVLLVSLWLVGCVARITNAAVEPVPDESFPPIEVIKRYDLPFPEDCAVDPKTESWFATGTNDGYVLRVDLATGEYTTILTPRDFSPETWASSTDEEMRAFCNGDALVKESTCGRVLGIKHVKMSHDEDCATIVIANAYFGLFEATNCDSPDHSQWSIQTLVYQTGGFFNDMVMVDEEDAIYYSVTHSFKQRNQLAYVIVDDQAPQGTFHRYDRSTGTASTILDGFYFTNGLARSTDGRFIYISETMKSRVMKFDLRTQTLCDEPFVDDLDIYTDNIWLDRGRLLIPGYWRNASLDEVLVNATARDEFLAQGPEIVAPTVRSWINGYGVLLVADEKTGKIVQTIFNRDGDFNYASSVHPLHSDDDEYDEYMVGSVLYAAATHFRVRRDYKPKKKLMHNKKKSHRRA